uniref:Caspase family p20 domain-containing protein n=1 Tax=Panagrolaimus davidi TaxID=227884 RepID=A0A914P0Y1_9BILA
MDMLRVAQKFATDRAHKFYDSSIVFVLTHGEKDALCGSDDQQVNIHDFLSCFNSKNAPMLKGKPKLFFLQACRGTSCDPGVDSTDNLSTLFSCLQPSSDDALQLPEKTVSSIPAISATQNTTGLSQLIDTPKQPIEADMLIAYATPQIMLHGDVQQ